jgi:hypothetical protein
MFRAWWLVILTAFADTSDMPTAEDLNAALLARKPTFWNLDPRSSRFEYHVADALLSQFAMPKLFSGADPQTA